MRDDQALALRWAFEELVQLAPRVSNLTDQRTYNRDLFVSATHAVWWVAALDNYCHHADKPGYAERRDDHDFGPTVRGVMWLRDRLMYQMPTSFEHDATPFLPGPPFFISPGIAWRRASDLPPADTERERFRPDYDSHVAGMGVSVPIYRCLTFFQSEAETELTPLWQAMHTDVDIAGFERNRRDDP